MTQPGLPVFRIINLDRSPERMDQVRQSARTYDIPVERVPAVDGATLDPAAHPDVDVRRFARANGRPIMAGEVGCYLSHMRALEQVAEGADAVAVICEDDVVFGPDTARFVAELAKLDGWDVVKLFSFRNRGFVVHRVIDTDHAIGRCIHGPVGSSAGYAVTREGARRLLRALKPMFVPYDVALERGWNGQVRFFMVDNPVIGLQPGNKSTIVAKGGYRRTKFPFYRRLSTLRFRAGEYARRTHFALSPSTLRGIVS